MHSTIAAIEYYLPETILRTDDLAREFPEWSIEKVELKTGINARHIAGDNEYASDLAVAAARKIFESGKCAPENIDFLLLCTQSPDYLIPTTACILQDRLGIPTTSGALDYNLGCSGYVFGLGLAEGLICTGQARSILLLTADTYSKYLNRNDKSCRAIFGDGASATLIVGRDITSAAIGPFVYGTDGRGSAHLMLPNSGTKRYSIGMPVSHRGNKDCTPWIQMDGHKMFNFAIDVAPKAVESLLSKAKIDIENVALFIFHQANAYIIEAIRDILGISREKIQLSMAHCGNTVSSTIPIALKEASLEKKLREGQYIMLIGFGVGFSWGATLVKWTEI